MSDIASHSASRSRQIALEGNIVEIVRDADAWIVRITENGDVFERDFEMEVHASSFADGQRIRLGLLGRFI